MPAVRLIVTGRATPDLDVQHSAGRICDLIHDAEGTIGLETLAVTDIALRQPYEDSAARFEVGLLDGRSARAIANIFDQIDSFKVNGGRFHIDEIDGIELDIHRRAQLPQTDAEWLLRFTSPTSFGSSPYPALEHLLGDILTALAGTEPDLVAPFVGRDLASLASIARYDLQAAPVGRSTGWVGWIELARAPEGKGLPIGVLLHASEIIGLGRGRARGHGAVRVSEVRHRNLPNEP